MNESQVEHLLSSFRNELGECRRAPTPKPRQNWRLAIAGIAVFAGALLVWPRDAAAGAMDSVSQALSNVTSMEYSYSQQRSDGTWHRFSHVLYREGRWRHEIAVSTGLQHTSILRDGLVLTDYAALPHATLDVADPEYHRATLASGESALEYVMRHLDQGSISEEREMSLHDHEPVGGRPTYLLRLSRETDGYQADIVVDKQSNLPIRAESVLGLGVAKRRFLSEYRFNVSMPDRLFELTSDKLILRLPEAKKHLAEAWKKPIGEAVSTKVRAATVMSDGTIFIACTAPGEGEVYELPTSLKAGDGVEYLRFATDITPSAILGKNNDFRVNGESAIICAFVPLEQPQRDPTSATITFTTRPGKWAGFSHSAKIGSTPSMDVHVSLSRERGNLPSYFPALDLDHFGFQVPIFRWKLVADELEKRGDLTGAVNALLQEAEARKNFIRVSSAQPLRHAAELLKKLGDQARARELEAEAQELERTGKR